MNNIEPKNIKKNPTNNKLSYVIRVAISKIVIVALEYKIDLSRLKVIELDNNNRINEMINI